MNQSAKENQEFFMEIRGFQIEMVIHLLLQMEETLLMLDVVRRRNVNTDIRLALNTQKNVY